MNRVGKSSVEKVIGKRWRRKEKGIGEKRRMNVRREKRIKG